MVHLRSGPIPKLCQTNFSAGGPLDLSLVARCASSAGDLTAFRTVFPDDAPTMVRRSAAVSVACSGALKRRVRRVSGGLLAVSATSVTYGVLGGQPRELSSLRFDLGVVVLLLGYPPVG